MTATGDHYALVQRCRQAREAAQQIWRRQLLTYRQAVLLYEHAARRSQWGARLDPPDRQQGQFDRLRFHPRPAGGQRPSTLARPGPDPSSAPLTGRQLEIARLVTQGLSNPEIAERLVLTRGTVANHVEHILHRLNVRSRAQIAAWVVARGLDQPG